MYSPGAGFSGRAPKARRLIRTGVFTAVALSGGAIGCAWLLFFRIGSDDGMALAALLCLTLAASAGAFLLRQIILDLAAREQDAARLAGHDLLSGLANRLLFSQWIDYELARHGRENSQFALMYLDLDRFKDINDTHGHDVGDRMIAAVARRLAGTLRPTDRLARIGGDEFAILQTGVRTMRDAEALALRIIEAMSASFDLDGIEVQSATSIGIALCPDNSAERDELMKIADLALYRAKREGRGRLAFFDARLGDELARAHVFERELAQAIENDALVLDYQPAYDGQTMQMRMVEARLRWPHPSRGLIDPREFLANLGDRKLVLPIGGWVLKRACLDAAEWSGQRIGVNISAQHFRMRDFAPQVLHILHDTSFDPERLEFQLNEDALLTDSDVALDRMKALRKEGVRFALTGFGTGLAGLSWLRRFPISRLRLDRSCLDHLHGATEGAAILHADIHLARELGMSVAADGVETEEQLRILVALGCQIVQGHHFNRHMSEAEITRLLRSRSRSATRDCA